jgi:dTDP-4-dehydrorhamnose reductase
MNILLLGANGQVGWELQRSLNPLGEVTALDRHSTGLCGNLANLDGLRQTVLQLKPDVIVNAAAYTAVDRAESDMDAARLINAAAPGVLAQAAAAVGAWLVHYSTDYVFDGSGSKPWVETDPTGPLNVYGKTKLEGEQLIAWHCQNYLIFRTSWVYAARGGNFAKTMLRLAKERATLNLISDQSGAPTGADLIADVTAHALVQVMDKAHPKPGLAAVYHLAAGGETTWFDYAKHVIAQSIRAQVAPELIVKVINPVASSAFPTAAQRPHNSRLNSAKLQASFGLSLPPWQTGVDRMLAEIL